MDLTTALHYTPVYTPEIAEQLAAALKVAKRAGLDFEYDLDVHGQCDKPVGAGIAIERTHLVDACFPGLSIPTDARYLTFYLPIAHLHPNLPKRAVQSVLGAFKGQWAVWSGDGDAHCLSVLGFTPIWAMPGSAASDHFAKQSDAPCWLYDGMVAAWRATSKAESQLGLKGLAGQILQVHPEQLPDFAKLAKGRAASECTAEELGDYCGRDAFLALALTPNYAGQLRERNLAQYYYAVDMPAYVALSAMRRTGMRVNPDKLKELEQTVSNDVYVLREGWATMTRHEAEVEVVVDEPYTTKKGKQRTRKRKVKQLGPFSPSPTSPIQIAKYCYEVAKVWPTKGLRKTKGGVFPCSKFLLEKFAAQGDFGGDLARTLLELRAKQKLLSTYIKPMLERALRSPDNRLHPRQALCGTETQRFSHSQPNFANLPSRTELGKMIRAAVEATPGWEMVVCDLSQAELRIAAELSDDPELLDAYERGVDVHAGTLEKLRELGFKEAKRVDAKTTNFSSMYGITAATLAIKARVPREQAEVMLRAHRERFRVYWAWEEKQAQELIRTANGRIGILRTLDGFERKIELKWRKNKDTKQDELVPQVRNQIANTRIQGTVAGIVKIAIGVIHSAWSERPNWRARLLMTEHDSIVFECPPEERERATREVQFALTNAIPLLVPLVSDATYGKNWAECK